MSIIEVKSITKRWGNNTVLKSVDLAVESSEIVGITGHNGSGKTVLMKCICGFITPDSGEITVSGKRIGKDMDLPKNIGLIIETPGFLPNFSGFSNLWQLAKIRSKISRVRPKRKETRWEIFSRYAAAPWNSTSNHGRSRYSYS